MVFEPSSLIGSNQLLNGIYTKFFGIFSIDSYFRGVFELIFAILSAITLSDVETKKAKMPVSHRAGSRVVQKQRGQEQKKSHLRFVRRLSGQNNSIRFNKDQALVGGLYQALKLKKS